MLNLSGADWSYRRYKTMCQTLRNRNKEKEGKKKRKIKNIKQEKWDKEFWKNS